MVAVAKGGKRARRKGKPAAPPTARPPTISARVSSPYTPGTIDRVERVLDSVLQLRRSRQITEEQYQAARTYQAAYEELQRGIGSAMDPSQLPGGHQRATICERRLDAAKYLKTANAALDAVGARVFVEEVVGKGGSLACVSAALWPSEGRGGPSQRQRNAVGLMLRAGLDKLAHLSHAKGRL